MRLQFGFDKKARYKIHQDMMYKLSRPIGDAWTEHSHRPVFARQANRLVVGIPNGDKAVIQSLLTCMEPSFYLLYVLHTPRGEAAPGRYQSPLLEQRALDRLLNRYATYLAADARFDLWIHSPSDAATIVWDRHDLIFAYGPIPCFESRLKAIGFGGGDPSVDFPHQHHYRQECDGDARAFLQELDWKYSELRPEDEQ
jgi:hypothetical protein